MYMYRDKTKKTNNNYKTTYEAKFVKSVRLQHNALRMRHVRTASFSPFSLLQRRYPQNK